MCTVTLSYADNANCSSVKSEFNGVFRISVKRGRGAVGGEEVAPWLAPILANGDIARHWIGGLPPPPRKKIAVSNEVKTIEDLELNKAV